MRWAVRESFLTTRKWLGQHVKVFEWAKSALGSSWNYFIRGKSESILIWLLFIFLLYGSFKVQMFYKVSEKEMLKDRNEIFLKDIVPILKEKGFEKSPFKSSCFGYCNSYLYIYEMCRINNSLLEFVETDICRKDKYIQIHINSFKLTPEIRSVSSLKELTD